MKLILSLIPFLPLIIAGAKDDHGIDDKARILAVLRVDQRALSTGSCCEAREEPGCCNAECQNNVNTLNPDADCLTKWTDFCVSIADEECCGEGGVQCCSIAVPLCPVEPPLDEALINCDAEGRAVITPCQVPQDFEPFYKGDPPDVDISIVAFGCSFCNGNKKTIDKLAGGSCQVYVSPDKGTFTITDSGGVGDFIFYTVQASRPGSDPVKKTCTICVDDPSKSCNKDKRKLRSESSEGEGPGKGNGPFMCPPGWDFEDPFECGDSD